MSDGPRTITFEEATGEELAAVMERIPFTRFTILIQQGRDNFIHCIVLNQDDNVSKMHVARCLRLQADRFAPGDA
jgi:hypothetical protein